MTAVDLQEYKQGRRVWVPKKKERWIGATVFSPPETDKLTVKTDDGDFVIVEWKGNGKVVVKDEGDEWTETHTLQELPVRNPDFLNGCDDLTALSHLHEPDILHNLSLRYKENKIYTYTGSILIALNPWREVPQLYSEETVRSYLENTSAQANTPHVYSVASAAYRAVLAGEKNQSLLVSGDSGAGKTETCKIVMHFLAFAASGLSSVGRIETRILESNPVLEAFGNAATLRNDNSSRFGKYTELLFSTDGRMVGAKIDTYLLEKSRVVHQNAGDRNFHIFYQMLRGLTPEALTALGLTMAEDYYYLSQSGVMTVDSKNDKSDFEETVEALGVIGVSDDEREPIFRILAAILHMGNLRFEEDSSGQGSVRVTEASRQSLQHAARLLQVSENALQAALVERKTFAGAEGITHTLKKDQVLDARDALSKALYVRLFEWLVARINASIHGESSMGSLKGDEETRSIGILDIFGFEYFEENSFEQLCINYANEKVQQVFNNFIFRTEQKEYQKEQISWNFVDFRDNQGVLDLFEDKINGVFSTLEEECRMPQGTDQGFVQKLLSRSESRNLQKHKYSNSGFVVKHYAGDVAYDCHMFLDKTRDALHADLIPMIQGSSCNFTKALFPSSMYYRETMSQNRTRRRSMRVGSLAAGSVGGAPTSAAPTKMFSATIGSQFQKGMKSLAEKLNNSVPHFIRCVKPNAIKRPRVFETHEVAHQLLCAGVLEAVRIMRDMYPTRIPHETFQKTFTTHEWQCYISRNSGPKYTPLAPGEFSDFEHVKAKCLQLCPMIGLKDSEYAVGRSKVFFRAGILARLEESIQRYVFDSASAIRKVYLGRNQRRKYRAMRVSALKIQKRIRVALAKLEVEKRRREKAAIRIQRLWRKIQKVSGFRKVVYEVTRQHKLEQRAKMIEEKREASAIIVQAAYRRHQHWSAYTTTRRGVLALQSRYRGAKVRSKIKINKKINVVEEKMRLARAVSDFERTHAVLDARVQELETEVSVKDSTLARTKEQNDFLEAELAMFKMNLIDMTAARTTLEDKCANLEDNVLATTERLTRCEDERSALDTEASELRAKVTELTAAKEQLEKDRSKLEHDLKSTQDELSTTSKQMNGRIEYLEKSLQSEREEKESLSTTLINEKGTVGSMSKVIRKLKLEISRLRDMAKHVADDARLEAQKMQADTEKVMSDKINVLVVALERQWTRNFELEEVRNSLQDDIETMEGQMENMVNDIVRLESDVAEKSQQYWRTNDEKIAAQKQVAKAAGMFTALNKRRERIEEALGEKEKELDSLKATLYARRQSTAPEPRNRTASIAPGPGGRRPSEPVVNGREASSSVTSTKSSATGFLTWMRGNKRGLSLHSEELYLVDRNRILKEGWLVKEGRKRKSWKKRYFVLMTFSLNYYGDSDLKVLKGEIPLEACGVQFCDDKTLAEKRKGMPKNQGDVGPILKLFTQTNRTLFVYGDNEEDTRSWGTSINTALSFNTYLRKAVATGGTIDNRLGEFMEGASSCPEEQTTFYLDSQPVALEALVAVQQPLSDHAHLQYLNLSNAGLSEIHCTVISNVLSRNHSIVRLHLNSNKIGDGGATLLAEGLKVCTTVSEVHLHSNRIGGEGCAALAEMIKERPGLKTITFYDNRIDDVGAKALGEALQHEHQLDGLHCMPVLDLSQNQVSDSGCAALAEMLKKNYTIVELILCRNRVGNEGVAALAAAVGPCNQSLEVLDLSHNVIGNAGCGSIAKMLDENHSILSVDLGANNFSSGNEFPNMMKDVMADANISFAEFRLDRKAAQSRASLRLSVKDLDSLGPLPNFLQGALSGTTIDATAKSYVGSEELGSSVGGGGNRSSLRLSRGISARMKPIVIEEE